MTYNLTKKEFLKIIEEVYERDQTIKNKIDLNKFESLYFDKIVKRLKDTSTSKYKFDRSQYQTSIRLYFYYSQEKDIYNILLLAMLESRLFDEGSN